MAKRTIFAKKLLQFICISRRFHHKKNNLNLSMAKKLIKKYGPYLGLGHFKSFFLEILSFKPPYRKFGTLKTGKIDGSLRREHNG